MNLAPGATVTELEVFEIKLNTGNLDEAILRQIDKEIPYHILFLLEYGGKYQAWIGYKEAAQSGNNAFKEGTVVTQKISETQSQIFNGFKFTYQLIWHPQVQIKERRL